MRITSPVFSATFLSTLTLLLVSGTSFAGRYVDQHNPSGYSSTPTQYQGHTMSQLRVGRGGDRLHSHLASPQEQAEFAVMEVSGAPEQDQHNVVRGGRAVDYR